MGSFSYLEVFVFFSDCHQAIIMMFDDMQAHIERALHGHFLFRRLTDSQCHVLLDCMHRIEVKHRDVVVQQVVSCLDICHGVKFCD